ncbi:variable large family protein (plasmid) [Borrelia miyamotoi]|uniref:Variable large protein n=2 Tax=Borrelia miyamotoi TaxID=47466 RepID=A0AAQ3CMU2_9SPIR|nr:variable large family protein [Borrelia miyamotoi]AHH05972.1 Variable major outer membrane lipoprotein [Borrelia miyamotoi FR64b]ATQ15515.1 variable large family protein [Borrelia miyamotoi]ATQ17913.1 variable large family protein [Borrelia miyamotoi]ATQ19140.1 variable large family protein [Borrelia miyamotoi]ATQ20204.1 variable large family protein [Borrelia miyamotoi]
MEKRSERKNILIIMMIVLLMIGCGQQTDVASGGVGSSLSGAMMEMGRSAERAFYAFIELMSDTLGFRVTKDTKKSDVAGYFNNLGGKLGEASAKLEQVAVKAEGENSKDGLLKKAIREAVDTAKITLNTLKGYLDSLKDIGDDNKVVDVTSNQQGVAADTEKLKAAYNALKGIVDTAKTGGEVKEPSTSNVTLASNSIGVTDAKNGAKVLTTGASGASVGDKAAAIVSSVSGEEMLESIIKSKEGDADAALTANANGDTNALKFAKGATADYLAQDTAKASAVSGGIALRSLVKGGKLASHNNNDEKAVQSAGITAVNKLLVAVEDIIKKTVKNVLEKAKEKIDEARNPKAAE